MKIWHIEQNENPYCDAFWAHIIEAKNENQVREIAAYKASGEGPEVWLNSNTSEVTLIGEGELEDGDGYIWLSDYYSG